MRLFVFKAFRRYGVFFACALLSAATFFLCALAASSYRANLENQFGRETSNIAKLLISDFDNTVTFIDDLLLRIVSDYASIEDKLSDNPQLLDELLKEHTPARSTAITLLSATDKNGMLIATGSTYPFSPYDVANKSDFIFHTNDPIHSKLYISAPEYGRVSQEWIISPAVRNHRIAVRLALETVSALHRIPQYACPSDKRPAPMPWGQSRLTTNVLN